MDPVSDLDPIAAARTSGHRVTIEQEHPDSDNARAILRAYIEDVASRYHGRAVTKPELAAVLAEFRNDDLAPPHGALLIALIRGAPVGCVGLRIVATDTGEVTRLFVAPPHRGLGLGDLLMTQLERQARDRGLTRLRLDTRHDLIEARGLYSRRGFREVARFNSEPYAEHWFEKNLA
jgi:GNAT superfamily N-acetyltransferase